MEVNVKAVEDADCPRDVLLALSEELTRRQSNLGKYAQERGLNVDKRAAMEFLPPNEREIALMSNEEVKEAIPQVSRYLETVRVTRKELTEQAAASRKACKEKEKIVWKKGKARGKGRDLA